MIGSTARFITKRMTWDGSVHNDPAKNNFISVGKSGQVAIDALHEVYGAELCPAALCSSKPGDWRCQCCDMRSQQGHEGLGTKAHLLPAKSGPNHKTSWKQVLSLTDKVRRAYKKRKRK